MIHNFTVEMPYEHILLEWKELLLNQGLIEGHHIHIRKAIPEDGMVLNIREEQEDTFDNSDFNMMVRIHAFLNLLTPMNYTIFHNDQLLFMVTVTVPMNGVAEVSFLVDKAFVESSKRIRFAMIRAFKEAVSNLPFRRIQAKVNVNFDIGLRFVENLGFEKEGLLKHYGPNNTDYIMYALVR